MTESSQVHALTSSDTKENALLLPTSTPGQMWQTPFLCSLPYFLVRVAVNVTAESSTSIKTRGFPLLPHQPQVGDPTDSPLALPLPTPLFLQLSPWPNSPTWCTGLQSTLTVTRWEETMFTERGRREGGGSPTALPPGRVELKLQSMWGPPEALEN